ncbi:MAG TPA: endonuclease III [Bacteroidales bacterium]|nr:endonuclease III [Bacteroidales bacterium]
MTLKERYRKTIEYFLETNPFADTELEYDNPFELVVAVILSAQCTDKRVNMIMPALIDKYHDAESMSKASAEEIFHYIKSCSYPNNKSKHLAGMSRMLFTEFGGIVPSDPDQLQRLPGVGRKTANVLLSVLYKKPVMAVDTHVFRVANRIGLTVARNPSQCELQLTKNIPEDFLNRAHHWLILHGRYVCMARNPLCTECGITDFCKYYQKNRNLKANKNKIKNSLEKS